MRQTLPVIVLMAVCGLTTVGCGSEGGADKRSKATSTPTATPTSTPPAKKAAGDDRPQLTADAPAAVRRCAEQWNASIKRDERGLRSRVGRIARNQAKPGIAVALYDGPKVKERRDDCLIMVSKGEVTLPPFSRARGKRGWLTGCSRVSAESNPKATRRCTPYKRTKEHVGKILRSGGIAKPAKG